MEFLLDLSISIHHGQDLEPLAVLGGECFEPLGEPDRRADFDPRAVPIGDEVDHFFPPSRPFIRSAKPSSSIFLRMGRRMLPRRSDMEIS